MNKSLLIATPFLVCGLLLSNLQSINISIFNEINGFYPNQHLWRLLTAMGDGLFIGCVLFIIFRHDLQLLTGCLLAGLTIHLISRIGKVLIGTLRPEHSHELDTINLFGPSLDIANYAMPSGHSLTVFMAAAILATRFNFNWWKSILIYSLASSAALSRIAIGAHWPADCFVGAGIGIAVGTIFSRLSVNLSFPYQMPIVYFLYSIFIVLSIKAWTKLFQYSPHNLVIALTGTIALLLWFKEVLTKLSFRKSK